MGIIRAWKVRRSASGRLSGWHLLRRCETMYNPGFCSMYQKPYRSIERLVLDSLLRAMPLYHPPVFCNCAHRIFCERARHDVHVSSHRLSSGLLNFTSISKAGSFDCAPRLPYRETGSTCNLWLGKVDTDLHFSFYLENCSKIVSNN